MGNDDVTKSPKNVQWILGESWGSRFCIGRDLWDHWSWPRIPVGLFKDPQDLKGSLNCGVASKRISNDPWGSVKVLAGFLRDFLRILVIAVVQLGLWKDPWGFLAILTVRHRFCKDPQRILLSIWDLCGATTILAGFLWSNLNSRRILGGFCKDPQRIHHSF